MADDGVGSQGAEMGTQTFSQLPSLEETRFCEPLLGSMPLSQELVARFPPSQPSSQEVLLDSSNPLLALEGLCSAIASSNVRMPTDNTLFQSGPFPPLNTRLPEALSSGPNTAPSYAFNSFNTGLNNFNSLAYTPLSATTTHEVQPLKERSTAGGNSRQPHHSLLKPEHKNSRATRRGPMDEMRQLVRILVKLMPDSLQFLAVSDEGGGGNRVSEDQIKEYLKRTLGKEPPEPEWGLPAGWGEYLAVLFSWAAGRIITREEAMSCARRLPGRSWEAVDEALVKLGLYPHCWPLPLTLEGIGSAPKTPAPSHIQPMEANNEGNVFEQQQQQQQVAHVDSGDGGGSGGSDYAGTKRSQANTDVEHMTKRLKRRDALLSLGAVDMADLTEVECWRLCAEFAGEALRKAAPLPADQLEGLNSARNKVQALVNSMKEPIVLLSPNLQQQHQQHQQQQQQQMSPQQQLQHYALQLQLCDLPPLQQHQHQRSSTGGTPAPGNSTASAGAALSPQFDDLQNLARAAAELARGSDAFANLPPEFQFHHMSGLPGSGMPAPAPSSSVLKPQAIKKQMQVPQGQPAEQIAVKMGSSSSIFRPYHPSPTLPLEGYPVGAYLSATAAAGCGRDTLKALEAIRQSMSTGSLSGAATSSNSPPRVGATPAKGCASPSVAVPGSSAPGLENGGRGAGTTYTPFREHALSAVTLQAATPLMGILSPRSSQSLRNSLHGMMESAAERSSGSPANSGATLPPFAPPRSAAGRKASTTAQQQGKASSIAATLAADVADNHAAAYRAHVTATGDASAIIKYLAASGITTGGAPEETVPVAPLLLGSAKALPVSSSVVSQVS